MIIQQSKLFSKTRKETPKEAKTPSHKFLLKAGYIDQLASGIWSLLPLGFLVHKKIEEIIRQEMVSIGAQEIFLPTLQPKSIWDETGRWETIDPPLFQLKDRHEKIFGLGSTHEEVITDLARKYISSYKQLPLAVFQIQNKFRNELRSSGGLLRVREFVMKDLYSFHTDQKDLSKYYEKVLAAYLRVFKRCGLEAVPVEASSGSIGGNYCHEFMIPAPSGEGKIVICPKCDFAANSEVIKEAKQCPNCKSDLEEKTTIEAGHIFQLGDTYSKKMKAEFIDKSGHSKPLVMGCYGIGLGRLLACIIEVNNDQDGIIWPEQVSPFDFHLLSLHQDKSGQKQIQQILDYCQDRAIDILYDDRELSAGQKLKDADLIGISKRIVISSKTLEKDSFELKERKKDQVQLIKISKLSQIFKNV